MDLILASVIAVLGEVIVLHVLGTSGITGFAWVILSGILPGSLATMWIVAAAKSTG